jgi:ankyrin repeat protein
MTDKSRSSLLMETPHGGAERVAEFLIQQGLSVHAVDDKHQTPLHCAAAFSEATATVHLLLEHGADVRARGPNNTTPLHSAATTGQLQNAELLLAAGADACVSAKNGVTPLHVATQASHTAFVELLLEHGATAVLNTMQCKMWADGVSVSTLMLCKDTATLKLLLTAGADVQAVTSSGDTCLHIAVRHSYPVPVLCMLIKAGADIHAVNERGKTAAQVAHDKGYVLIEQLLNRVAARYESQSSSSVIASGSNSSNSG